MKPGKHGVMTRRSLLGAPVVLVEAGEVEEADDKVLITTFFRFSGPLVHKTTVYPVPYKDPEHGMRSLYKSME